LLQQQDSIFGEFYKAASARHKAGEGTFLEKTTAETQFLEVQNLLRNNSATIRIVKTQLQTLLNIPAPPEIKDNVLTAVDLSEPLDTVLLSLNPI
jgi:cobalt-zinc-cadmium resistance protein CzcA